MQLKATHFRANAREALREKWGIAILVGLVASLLGGSSRGTGGVSLNINLSDLQNGGSTTGDSVGIIGGLDPAVVAILTGFLSLILIVALAVSVVLLVVGSMVEVGYARFNLNLIDKQETGIGNLFAYFTHWKRVLPAQLLRALYVFLWSLLFIIPGIIAGYSYAMTPYILAEDPSLSAGEALARSKQMMQGNRWRLFCLEISFIGWAILCGFTCGIGYYVLAPYEMAARADFYREVSGTRPVIEGEADAPTEAQPV